VATSIAETKQSIPKFDDTKLTEQIAALTTELQETKQLATEQKKDFETILGQADKNVEGLTETVKTLENWKHTKEQEIKETETKTKDREEFAKALKEVVAPLNTKIENLSAKLKGDMKQSHKVQETETEDLGTDNLPYDK